MRVSLCPAFRRFTWGRVLLKCTLRVPSPVIVIHLFTRVSCLKVTHYIPIQRKSGDVEPSVKKIDSFRTRKLRENVSFQNSAGFYLTCFSTVHMGKGSPKVHFKRPFPSYCNTLVHPGVVYTVKIYICSTL